MIDPTERLNWITEAQPLAERIADALSGLTSNRHIYAALRKLEFKPFSKRLERTAAGISPRVSGDFVVKSMHVSEGYDPKFCLPTLVLRGESFVPLQTGHKQSEKEIVLQPLCYNDIRRISSLWLRDDSPFDELNDFLEAAPTNIGIWKGKPVMLDW